MVFRKKAGKIAGLLALSLILSETPIMPAYATDNSALQTENTASVQDSETGETYSLPDPYAEDEINSENNDDPSTGDETTANGGNGSAAGNGENTDGVDSNDDNDSSNDDSSDIGNDNNSSNDDGADIDNDNNSLNDDDADSDNDNDPANGDDADSGSDNDSSNGDGADSDGNNDSVNKDDITAGDEDVAVNEDEITADDEEALANDDEIDADDESDSVNEYSEAPSVSYDQTIEIDGNISSSALMRETYFREQLTDLQKQIFDEAKRVFLNAPNNPPDWPIDDENEPHKGMYISYMTFPETTTSSDYLTAISAFISSYPNETEWMSIPNRYDTMGISFGMSKFYSNELELKARDKIAEIKDNAILYAAENYPDAMTYGVIRYFDQWICENGYYLNKGGGPEFYDKEEHTSEEYELFYKCHRSYGILLDGKGVCESYARLMTRLLDAADIPNMLIPGDIKVNGVPYGHMWNYVQMPDGKWYMIDSTFDDDSGSGGPNHKTSNRKYLLVTNNGNYIPNRDILHNPDVIPEFKLPELADSNYDYTKADDSDNDFGLGEVTIKLDKEECNLIPKGKETLTCTITDDKGQKLSGTSVVFSSSNTKIAKVDQNGGVTAVSAGSATIYAAAFGTSTECKINVDQVKTMKSENTGKTSESISLGIDDKNKPQKEVALIVDMGQSPHTAQWMLENKKTETPQITCSKTGIVKAELSSEPFIDNRIIINLQALSAGSTNVTVKFAGKKVTLKVTAGQLITKEMFDIKWPENGNTENDKWTTPYTGKAIKPIVKKKTDEQYKTVKFKTSYVHNKDAGNAKVVITGSGQWGGTLEYDFVITPLDITDAVFSKELQSKAYNGGANPPNTSVKFNKKTLKANKDYKILYSAKLPVKAQDNTEANTEEKIIQYNNVEESVIMEANGGALPVGAYTITIIGIGNYTGTVKQAKTYNVTQNTIAKVSVSGSGSAKYTGIVMNPYTVKIGKNILTDTDYNITWYNGQGNNKSTSPMKTAPSAKGKYTAVITVKGNNLTNTDNKKEIVKKFTIK